MSSSDGINNSNHTTQEFWNRSSETGLIKVCMQTVKLLQNVFDLRYLNADFLLLFLFSSDKIKSEKKKSNNKLDEVL